MDMVITQYFVQWIKCTTEEFLEKKVLKDVVSDFLTNRTNFVGGDKLLPVIKHGFLRSEENVFPAILNTHKVCGKMFFFIISNVCVWLVLLPYI